VSGVEVAISLFVPIGALRDHEIGASRLHSVDVGSFEETPTPEIVFALGFDRNLLCGFGKAFGKGLQRALHAVDRAAVVGVEEVGVSLVADDPEVDPEATSGPRSAEIQRLAPSSAKGGSKFDFVVPITLHDKQ